MKYLLIILALSSQCVFGEWQKWENIKSLEEIDDRQFRIPSGYEANDYRIFAIDYNLDKFVHLRYSKDKCDYEIAFKTPLLFETQAHVYLQLLDDEGFLLQEYFISKVNPNFYGYLRGSFQIDLGMFRKVKSFHIAYRY